MAARAKQAPVKPSPGKESGRAAAGLKGRLKKDERAPAWRPNETEREVQGYVERRTDEMIDFRRGLGLEQKWREADGEYIPHELDFGTTRKRFETDQDTGLRSRMVPVGDSTQQWRQASSAPTLLAKIQTAIGIIVDQQPEGEMVAMGKKYMARTDLVYAAWKRNWQITNAKEKLKVLIFDLAKYGWAAKRTYPHKVEYPKQVLVEHDPANPENDKYEAKTLSWFNDVDRQNLSVYSTWIDELARPYEPYSVNEDYFELDFSYDQAELEFGKYPNWKFLDPSADNQLTRASDNKHGVRSQSNATLMKRKDIVTIGFFESRHKDLYAIWIPKTKLVVYAGPMPNDDGLMQVTHTLWIMRDSKLPYGVSLWEIIRQNKTLYDKMKNMTMDQLVLSIMKFGFFSGTNPALGDGKIEIVPGQARQLTSSTGKPEVNWMEIPGPGDDAWKGLEAVAAMMDDDSGISPSLEGEITGKTLGEILHAKDASLKRLKVPVENIAWEIEQDAYLTISWMAQLYSIPTVMEFATEEELMAFEKEEEMEHSGPIMSQGEPDQDTGQMTGPFKAQFYPQLALHLEDSDGQLKEGKESRFFQIGEGEGQIKPGALKWRGVFKVIPRSIIDTSQDLVKAMKSELFNMIAPLLPAPPEIYAKSVSQIIKVNEEDPDDWLPDAWTDFLKNGPQPAPQGPPPPPPGAAGAPEPEGGTGAATVAPGGAPPGYVGPTPGMRQGNTIQGQAGLTPPQAATVVPGSAMPSIAQLTGGKPGAFGRRL